MRDRCGLLHVVRPGEGSSGWKRRHDVQWWQQVESRVLRRGKFPVHDMLVRLALTLHLHFCSISVATRLSVSEVSKEGALLSAKFRLRWRYFDLMTLAYRRKSSWVSV